MRTKPKPAPKSEFNWFETTPVKRKVFYTEPITSESPLLNLLNVMTKEYEDLLRLEKKAKRFWKKVKKARKEAR